MIKRKSAMTKYRAVKTVINGKIFDSKKEASRYKELILLEKSGLISHLELQPKYDCVVAGKKICSYRADFRYFDEKSCVIEDVKGYKTPVYKLKKKLVEALYPGVKIVEI